VNKINYSLLILAISIFLINCYDLSKFTVDDSFISYRYAENLVQGFGFSWNYNETQEFGFSNYSMVLLVALGMKLGIDPIFFSKMINISTGIVVLVFSGLLLKILTNNKFKYYFSVSLVLAIFPQIIIHSVSGLETTLFMTLVLLSSYFYLRFLHQKKYSVSLLIPCLIISILTRYEGVLLVGGIFLHMIYNYFILKNRSYDVKKFSLIILLPTLFTILLFSWNYFNFGQILPNSFIMKSVGSRDTLFFLINGFNIGKFALVLSPFLVLILLKLKSYIKNSPENFLIIQFLVFMTPFLFMSQEMNYLYRFYFPIVPLIIILSFASIENLKEKIMHYTKQKSWLIVPIIAFLIIYPISFYNDSVEFASNYTSFMNTLHIPIGKTLNDFQENSGTLAVVIDAGAIPFYSKWYVFDYYINDKFSANNGFDKNYFFEQNPEVITITFYSNVYQDNPNITSKQNLINELAEIQPHSQRKEIILHPEFQNYVLTEIYGHEPTPLYQYIFLRTDVYENNPEFVNALKDKTRYFIDMSNFHSLFN